MTLFQNIIDNYTFVKNDFIGLYPDINVLGSFLFNFLVSSVIMVVFFLLGNKIRKLFFEDSTKYNFFINILLGYVTVGTGLGLLGMFSLLQPGMIIVYLVIISLVAFSPYALPKFGSFASQCSNLLKGTKTNRFNKFILLGVALFVGIAFLRLLTPEIGEDGYHTDYSALYLKWQSTMHESREVLHVLSYPQLPEMIYLIPTFLGDKEAARFVHFYFYVLIILLLFTITTEKKYFFTKFVPLLFVTAPGVIKYSPTQYTDFFAIFPFILSFLLIKKDMSARSIILAGICFGAVVSAKIWMLVYLPILLIYMIILNRHLLRTRIIKMVLIFIASYVMVSLIWHVRAYLMMGSPIYPILNTRETIEIYQLPRLQVHNYLSLNTEMFTYKNMVILSPLFFLGTIFFFFVFRSAMNVVTKSTLFIVFILFTLEQLVIQVSWGRYLLTWFIFASFIASAGILFMFKKSNFVKGVFVGLYIILFSYYFINTLLTLPYGLGFADKNKYLTRTLIRQQGNYYDFNYSFSKHISPNDLVAVYSVGNLYYADFSYIDVGYIFDTNSRSLRLLEKAHVTKLLINGGDIDWFCSKLSLTDCDKSKMKLLAKFPEERDVYTLYAISN